MKRLALAFVVIAGPVAAQGYGYGTGSNPSAHLDNGYATRQGTYVAPHYQTDPNGTQLDNYQSRGNYNPYTGQTGTHSPRW